MTRGPREDELYRRVEAAKPRLEHDAADEALTHEALWLLGREVKSVAEALRKQRERDDR